MTPDLTDTLKTRPTLLSRVRRGDEDGWSQFYNLYEDFIRSAARAAGLSQEEAQDVLQEAMVTVRDYIGRFVPDVGRARFRTWLRRIVRSRIADHYRRKRCDPLERATADPPVEDAATSTTNRIPNLSEVELDRLVDGQLEQAILAEARKRVKEGIRMEDYQAYDLFEIQELSARDVAASLGINATTARVKAFRVRNAVERELRRIVKLLDKRSIAEDGGLARLPSRAANPEARKTPFEFGYECIKPIASGGYGYVYLCSTTPVGAGRRYVAGKFVYHDLFGPSDDASSRAAYQRAFEGLQNFRSLSTESPYLLRVFEVRQRHAAGYFCYMMELADDMERGQEIHPTTYKPRTLRHELERSGQRQRLPARECLAVAIALARGLQVLHESGFTHRDLRPTNIIFVNDVPKLADIDLLAGHDAALASYIPKDYAAPEGTHSSQADIYSFGKTLYEMCTGLPVKAYPILPPEVRHWEDHRLLLALIRVIGRACTREPRRRFASARLLVAELELIAKLFG